MLEERYGKFTILKLKLSRLSYTAVEYSPSSIVISHLSKTVVFHIP